ncbi:MAG: glycosyltransferase family 39 protein [Bacteroidia bacterium]|nr:glycosyltransferase family 39 protein [Bacteroidia bacterium]
MTIATIPTRNSVLRLCAVFAVVKILLHLYTNLFAGYGIFRDELYYVACTEHMAFGYVDHPPFSIWLLYVIEATIGKSVFAIRLLPALLGGGTVFLYGLITYELGGRKLAVSLTCLAVLLSGVHLAMGTFYSMNVIDMFLWPLALYGFITLFKTGNARLWWWLAALMGLMLLNKISALFFGAGLFIALLLTPERKWLATRWPFVAGMISVLLFSPYIIWNALHGWPHLEFIHNASTYKYQGMNPGVFWSQQLLIYNPFSLPLSLAGLVYFFRRQPDHYFRFIFLIFVTVGVILTINWHSKPEYLAADFLYCL